MSQIPQIQNVAAAKGNPLIALGQKMDQKSAHMWISTLQRRSLIASFVSFMFEGKHSHMRTHMHMHTRIFGNYVYDGVLFINYVVEGAHRCLLLSDIR